MHHLLTRYPGKCLAWSAAAKLNDKPLIHPCGSSGLVGQGYCAFSQWPASQRSGAHSAHCCQPFVSQPLSLLPGTGLGRCSKICPHRFERSPGLFLGRNVARGLDLSLIHI